MQAADREIKDQSAIVDILIRGRELRLAMIAGDRPYVLPLNYGYAEGCIYIHSARKGKKLDCLRSNPQVCFEVSEVLQRVGGTRPCDWSTKFRSVVGEGTAHIIDERAEKIQGYDAIMAHFGGPTRDYEEKHLSGSLIIRIDIETLTGKQNRAADA
ncbi:MAG TPA: pyridoxamine 5'-phosphate oxidase family protein [Malonomonas sp.]